MEKSPKSITFSPEEVPIEGPINNFLKEFFKNEFTKLTSDNAIKIHLIERFSNKKNGIIKYSDLSKEFSIETDFEFKCEYNFKPVKFRLQGSILLLLKLKDLNESDFNNKPLLIIDFNQVSAIITMKKNVQDQFRLIILGSNKNFCFKSKNPEIFQKVLISLNYQVNNSRGGQENLLGVSLREDFYLNYFISESDWIKDSLSGDLLIFKGYDCPAKCQRFFTRAEYDHIALLVKKDGRLFVYESTSKDGCKLRDWNDFVRYSWHVLYEKMVYRKLIVKVEESKRSEFMKEFDKNLINFIENTKGKPYRLTCDKLCCGKTKEYEINNEWERCKGFFCSQLVSAGLMKLNIINVSKGAGKYLPGAFSEKGNLDVTDAFEYGPEVIIDFSL